MPKKIIYLLLAVSLGLNIGVISTTLIHRTSGPRPGPPLGPGPGPGRQPAPEQLIDDHLQGMTKHLDLSLEQQAAIRVILERYADELITLQADAKKTGRLLAEAYATPVLDPEHFQRLVSETSAARSRLDSLSAVMILAEADVLTPQQRVKFSKVATTVHTNPQQTARPGGPPPGERRPPPR